eukprot:TRINITY_DN11584_c0_g1_i3.p1 TRINITY_DN11584_c0_g1~~TRINITY_DN11584_c0_g1_i3.p1  ORF type:complete len:308 (+),score=24.20 TRINITY_DN11584_c0_g1_i3:49-972(+)
MALRTLHACVAFLALMSCCCSAGGCLDCEPEGIIFLQSDVHKHKRDQQCGHLIEGCPGDPATFMNNNAICHTNRALFSRSIVDVMREHPGEDGFCIFNASAMYILYSPQPPDYVAFAIAGILGLRDPSYKGLNTGALVTFHWEGTSVTTHADLDHYLYDDLYEFSLGYLQNQGLDTSKMSDPQAWEELSRQQCEQVQATYQFRDEELIFNDLLDSNLPIHAQCHCAAGVPLPIAMQVPYVTEKADYHSPSDCKPITKREFARHHYMKCVLGYPNSASDMAYLNGRACLLPGNRIGHYTACPYSPPGV